MGLANVVPGRYTAMIKDWGMREVEKLDGALEAWVSFDFKDQSGADESITWKGLILRKDGERNIKTFKTLAECGLEGEDLIKFMDDTAALNMVDALDITIVDQPNFDGSKIYKNVEWVNKLGGGQVNKPTGEAAQDIRTKLARLGMGKLAPKKAPVKNHAPQTTKPVGRGTAANDDNDDNDEIPF